MIEIPLSQGKVALIDDADWEFVSGFKWYAFKDKNTFYARTNVRRADGTRTTIKMHRLLLGLTDPLVQADHIDGNGLNNRRSNLRACTNTENQWNTGAKINNTSGFKGVCWRADMGKWVAKIKVNGKMKHIGLFTTPEAAHAAYCTAAAELHGEFVNIGKPPTKRWSKPEFEIIHTGAPR